MEILKTHLRHISGQVKTNYQVMSYYLQGSGICSSSTVEGFANLYKLYLLYVINIDSGALQTVEHCK